MTPFRVAVIGGGYAGMAAATELAAAGAEVHVYEAARLLGGRARRIDTHGLALDNGQHLLSGAYTELLRLMSRVDVPDTDWRRIPLHLCLPPHFSLTAPHLPAPLHLAWALLTATGLRWRERLAAVRFMQALKASAYRVDRADTVEDLLRHHAQPDALVRYLWAPLTVSALNTPIGAASAQVLVNVLRDALAASRAASDLILPQTDLSALFPEPAAIWVAARGGTIHRGTRVTALRHADPQHAWQITSTGGTASDEALFSRAIVAVGPHQLDSIGLAELLPAPFRYEPICTVYLQYPSPVKLPATMFGQVHGLCQWFFDRQALTANQGLVAAVISASGPHLALEQASLVEALHQELQVHCGALPTPTWSKVITEKFATFACTPDLKRPPTKTHLPGLYLAGDYVDCAYPATLEAAVRNGVAAARAALASPAD